MVWVYWNRLCIKHWHSHRHCCWLSSSTSTASCTYCAHLDNSEMWKNDCLKRRGEYLAPNINVYALMVFTAFSRKSVCVYVCCWGCPLCPPSAPPSPQIFCLLCTAWEICFFFSSWTRMWIVLLWNCLGSPLAEPLSSSPQQPVLDYAALNNASILYPSLMPRPHPLMRKRG